MAVDIGTLRGIILLEDRFTAPIESFTSQIVKAENNLTKIGGNLDKMGAGFTKLGGALSIVSGGLVAAAVGAVQLASDFRQTEVAFTTMLGSGEKAKAFLADLEDFAAKTPFEFPELVTASQRMLAMGFAAEQVRPTLTAVGDAAAGLKSGNEGIQRITLALGQMQSRAKVSAEEMNQLVQQGIPAWELLAKKIGTTVPEAMERASKGAISAKVGIEALVEGMNQKFGGMMDKFSQTLPGQMSTIKDELRKSAREMGEALMPVAIDIMKIFQSMVPVIQSAVKSFTSLDEGTRRLIIGFGMIVIAIGPMLLTIGATIKSVGLIAETLGTARAALVVFGNTAIVTGTKTAIMNTYLTLSNSLLGQMALVGAAAFIGWEIGKAIDETFQLSKKIGELVAGVENLRRLEKGTGSVGALKLGIDPTQFETMDKWKAALDKVNAANAKMRAGSGATEEGVKKVTAATDSEIRALVRAKNDAETLTKAKGILGREAVNLAEAQKAVAIETAMSSKKIDESAQRIATMRTEMQQLAKAKEILFQAGQLPGQKGLSDPLFGLPTPELQNMLSQSTTKMIEDMQKLGEAKEILFQAGQLPGQKALTGPEALPGLATSISPESMKRIGVPAGISLGKSLTDSFKGALVNLPQVVMGALQGGGSVPKAVGALFGTALGESIGEALKKSVGGTLGKVLGAALPGIGSIVGAGLGSLAGKIFGGLFGGEGKKVNDLRDQFIAAQGGFDALAQKAAAAGTSLNQLLAADKIKEFEAAVGALNDKFREQQELLDTQKQAQEALNSAVERYGFTTEELPAKMQTDKIIGQLTSIFQDWQLLNAAGFDHQTMLERMGPNMVEWVNQARAASATIPEAMRPMIDELIKSGQLVDENGEAFTSAEEAGIKFGATIEESMMKAVEQIERLVNALLGINNVDVTPKIHLPGIPVEHGGKGDMVETLPAGVLQMQRGALVTKPTLGIFGEAGPELAIPLPEFREMLDAERGRGGGPVHVRGELDGRVLLEFIAEARRDNLYGTRTRLG